MAVFDCLFYPPAKTAKPILRMNYDLNDGDVMASAGLKMTASDVTFTAYTTRIFKAFGAHVLIGT